MNARYYWTRAAIVVVAAAVFWRFSGSNPSTNADTTPTVLVNTINLSQGSLPATVSAYGSVTAGPNAESTISMQASGVIAAIDLIQGQSVTVGDPLLTIAADAQSVADLHKAEGAVSAAKANRVHVAALLASHLATSADLAAADQMLNDADLTLTALQVAGAGKTRTITAPFAGTISALLVSAGTMQSSGTALLQIVKTSGLVAIVGVPPAQAMAIRPGDRASIKLLDTAMTIAGNVSGVSNILDPATGLTSVTVSPEAQAISGEPVEAVITTGILNGFVVPRDAVQNDQQGNYVFQIDAKNIAHRVSVQILGTSDTQTILAPDLNTSMRIVTTGAYQLDDGAAVRTVASGTSH